MSRREVSTLTKIGDREAVSRFFSWCIERPRRWATANPCREIQIKKPNNGHAPEILTVPECALLMEKAEAHRDGHLVAYMAVCLFGGLRPAEAQRLTWDKINLDDGEIRVEAQSTKTKQPRVVTIKLTLRTWLLAYKDKSFNPSNFRRDFDAIKTAAGYVGRNEDGSELKPWPHDVLRHTAISHFFLDCGSYGLTAEQFGNSGSVIKKHYQGRVSSADTKKFYAIKPKAAK